MKRVLPICLLLLLNTLSKGQIATPAPRSAILEIEQQRINTLHSPLKNIVAGNPNLQLLMGPGCTGTDLAGSSSNMFTQILTEANPLAVDNTLNTMVFLHRNNATAFGGNSGSFRVDLSTNGGVTWSSNLAPVNPLVTFPGRYPNAAIYNPSGNTNPNNAYIVYLGPTVNAGVFNSHVMGVRKIDNSVGTENYNQMGATNVLIPRSLVKGVPGTYWACEQVYNGTTTLGYRIMKGVWNGSTDVVWSENTTFTPTFNTILFGTNQVSDFAIAFDPTGMKGWFCALTHISPGPANYAFYPVFWKTTDGGVTWSGPDQVDLNQFPCIASNVISPNVVSTGFDIDLVVDSKGNPHLNTTVCTGDNQYAVFFGLWHHQFDITQEGGLWNAIDMGNVNAGRGTWGTAPNQVTMDMESQASRTDDGNKVFFTWSGSDAFTLGTNNQNPNLYGKAYDVINREWTSQRDFSTCAVATSGKIFFPKMAENVLNIAGGWELPVSYAEFTVGTDPIAISNFRFLDSLRFQDADFITSQCTAPVSIAQGSTVNYCSDVPGTLSIAGTFDAIRWSNGATTLSTNATTGGWYYVAARQGCCVGIDSIFVTIDTVTAAAYSQTSLLYTADFTDLSGGNPTSWTWDFGDGSPTSNLQNPSHVYSAIGDYIVCLTATDACGDSTICDTVSITCPAPGVSFSSSGTGLDYTFTNTSTVTGGATYSWDFGDGSPPDNTQNPTHSYTASGNYLVCLTVSDTCATDSSCQNITVTCATPSAAYNFSNNDFVFTFTDASSVTGAATYVWDFGDGATSTLQNPVHTYSPPGGTFVVCLYVSDACGSDTICDTINVSCASVPAASFTSNVNTGGVATFTNTTTPPADSYFWDFGDSQNSTNTNPTHTYTLDGNYTVCLYTTDSCGNDTICDSVSVTIVGVDDPFSQGTLTVFPNPSSNNFFIKSEIPGLSTVRLKLVNPLGQQLWSRETDGGVFLLEIPAANLSQGIYLLVAEANGHRIAVKLRKE